jgi:hypothetical protein
MDWALSQVESLIFLSACVCSSLGLVVVLDAIGKR